MSLKVKALCIVLVLLIVYVAAHGLMHRFIFIPGFLYLEQREAEKNMNRPLEAFKREMHHLSALVHDWSSWDDTYHFMNSGNSEYIASNLSPIVTYEVNTLNLMVLCDSKGKVLWRKAVDLKSKKDIPLPEIPETAFPLDHPFLRVASGNGNDTEQNKMGFINTSLGPMMVASRLILKSNNEGPSRGTLIMGRFISEEVVREMSVQTDVPFSIIPVGSNDRDAKPVLNYLINGKAERFVDAADRNNLYIYTIIKDIGGSPLFLIKVSMLREILNKGLQTLKYSMVSIVAAGFLILLLMLLLLHKAILNPLSVLTRHAVEVEETGDLTSRLDFNRNDEIGILAQRFDGMLVKLAEVRNELLDQSYYAGLAGIASDILHNSGNILMPIHQKIVSLHDLCRNIPKENIHKAMEEMEQGNLDPARENNLKRFLLLSIREMGKAVDQAVLTLGDLEQHAREIEHIMGGLEKFSRAGSTGRNLVTETLLYEACSRLPDDLRKACRIRFEPGIKTLPEVKAEPVVLVQIFGALLSQSATLSVSASGEADKAEVIVGGRIDGERPGHPVRILISGNGALLTSSDLKGMFARQYHGESSGLFHPSLHWCSNVVSAMGGELSVFNDDHGTVFHLVLPQGGDV